MATTYTLITKYELDATTASVTFSSIPQTYKDLIVRIVARATVADQNVNLYVRFNGDSSTNYSSISGSFYNTGENWNINSTRSQLDNGPWASGANCATYFFGTNTMYIANYTNSLSKQISVLGAVGKNASAGSGQWVVDESALYRGTSAITSITIPPYSGSFEAGSKFYLYGLASS